MSGGRQSERHERSRSADAGPAPSGARTPGAGSLQLLGNQACQQLARAGVALGDAESFHALGNHATQRYFGARAASSNDAAEREADAIAERSPGADAGGTAVAVTPTALPWPRSSGSQLDAGVRADLEARVGADLSLARVHSDRATAAFATAIGARAFTVGDHIGFAHGAYQPSSSEGQKLLAHEATHVAQQRGGGPTLARKDDVTAMTITPQYAQALSDQDLADDIDAIRAYVAGLQPTDGVYEQARQNRDILQDEQITRAVRGSDPDELGDEATLDARFERFKAGVLVAAQNRLTNNQEALRQWRSLIERQFSTEDLQQQVLAQSADDLTAAAQQSHSMPAVYDWAGEHNPYMRYVREQQAHGQWHACTGCHAALAADALAKDTPAFEQALDPSWRSPAERMGAMSGLFAPGTHINDPGTGQDFQILEAAVQRIHPILAPLGDAGYRIIPDDVWSLGSGASAQQLQTTIYANIDKRGRDYDDLKQRIADGDVDYLQLGPVLQSLLSIAPPDIQQAVQDDMDERKIDQYLEIAGTIALALLSILIPPLGLAAAAIGFASGYSTVQTGTTYGLGTGANDVFTREQQDQAAQLQMMGVLTMGMSVAAFAQQVPQAADWTATRVIVQSDLNAARSLAERALQGPVPEAELMQLQERGLVTRAAMKWTDFRGYRILYRGQAVPTEEILSPIARAEGLEASQNLYNQLRASGLTDEEIAGYTARYNGEPVPWQVAPPGMGGQPVGGAGIPTTRLPSVASSFAQTDTGVIYILRLPKALSVNVGEVGWPGMSAMEQEWVVFHQIPNGYVVRTVPPADIPPLVFSDSTLRVP